MLNARNNPTILTKGRENCLRFDWAHASYGSDGINTLICLFKFLKGQCTCIAPSIEKYSDHISICYKSYIIEIQRMVLRLASCRGLGCRGLRGGLSRFGLSLGVA